MTVNSTSKKRGIGFTGYLSYIDCIRKENYKLKKKKSYVRSK